MNRRGLLKLGATLAHFGVRSPRGGNALLAKVQTG